MGKRSNWKGPFIDFALFSEFSKLKKSKRKKIKIYTRSRSSSIFPSFVGSVFLVYNGKSYIPVKIKKKMVGYKLGEFSFSRKRPNYTGKDKKKR